jgi:predicted HTH transcriptional regulator
MTEDELRQAISLGREQRGTEFKGPGKRTDKHFQAKVIRAVLGMANKPGGGVIVIGIHDGGSALNPQGLSAEELATWTYDDLASNVSTYADPYVDFGLGIVEMDGKSFVAVEVSQFDELPVVCKNNYNSILRNGALYVRRRGKNETIEVPSHVEMREVVRRAAEAVARDMVASHERLREVEQVTDQTTQASGAHFDAEAKDLL